MSKASEGGITTKGFRKCNEIKTASSELFIKLARSIYVHSLEYRIVKHCRLLVLLLIVGDSVSTGYICKGKFPISNSQLQSTRASYGQWR